MLKNFNASHRVWQGIPSIERTEKGRIFLCFYSGETSETFGNYEVLIKSDGLRSFSEPIAAAYVGASGRCFDGNLWIDPLGRLWFIWNLLPDNKVCAVICDDPDADELVWSDVFYIGEGVMINKPTVLSSGEWLFPIAVWNEQLFSGLRNKSTDRPAAYVYKTCDNGLTFTKLGGADIRERVFDEHMLLEVNESILKMFVRTKYGIGVSASYDRGKNWTVGEDSGYGGPGSRFHIRRLASGRVLLINHYNFDGRNNLTALLSEDDGKTFPYSLLLDERAWVSYPDATEAKDGFIYAVYDRERGSYKKDLEDAYSQAREILLAKFTENDIISGKLVSEGSELKIVASKLGRLSPDAENPFEKIISDAELAGNWLRCDKATVLENLFRIYPFNCTENVEYKTTAGIDRLLAEFLEKEENDLDLLTELISCIRNIPVSRTDSKHIVERAINYIDDNLEENFSLDELSRELSVSKYYLSHIFSSSTGISIINYRIEKRITKAKMLLIESDLSISEIALSLGFGSCSKFSKEFSRHEKITPTKYRNLHRA